MSPLIRVSWPAVVTALLCVGLSAPALAAWPHDPNNGNVPVSTATNDQLGPVIVSDGSGGAIVIWQDYRSGTNYDIYAQRVNAAGVPQWTANGVALCSAADDQYNATIASDGAGGAIVTWHDPRFGGYDIYAQRVSAAGAPLWTANGVALCSAVNNQLYPAIVSDGSGGAIVTWQDGRGGVTFDVYAQRVNAAGVPQWTVDGVATCTAANNQYSPVIASDGSGGAIVAWYDYRSGTNYDIYAQRMNAAGAPQWTVDGRAVSTAAGGQQNPTLISDGSGGAIVTWHDDRSGTLDIYAQRVNAAGVSQWTLDGVALCTAANGQVWPTIASDGSGGAIVTWYDFRSGTSNDIYAQRVSAAGAPQWTANGVALSAGAGGQETPTIVADGSGGAIVAWHDLRSGSYWDVYAQRVNAAGLPQWTANGVAVSTAANDQVYPVIASDGSGGAIVTWYDRRSGSYDIYAQRVESSGYLGNPEPAIASVRDVPGDQGGKVKLSWDASYLEFAPYCNVIGSYQIFRSVPPNYVATAAARGARVVGGSDAVEAGPGTIIATPMNGQTYYWEYVGTQAAYQFAGYSYLAPTAQDSTSLSNLKTYFLVRAISTFQFWNSNPDSGYSVDNLPPFTPAPFTGAYSAGATHLHWGANQEVDLAGYRVYRGASSGFVPGPGNLITAQADTGFSDAGPAGSYYKLAAVDAHGNLSGYALLSPGGTLDSDPITPRTLALALASSNPARGEARLRCALPQEADIRLAIYDVTGREVREIERGSKPAGAFTARWDGLDASGREAGGGMYLARLRVGARSIVVRFVLLR